MRKDTKAFVMRVKFIREIKLRLWPFVLQPLLIPTHVWSDIFVEFIGGLPKSKGKDTIFVVVDGVNDIQLSICTCLSSG